MKNTTKTAVILDFICAVIWIIVSVMDIVNDGFTNTFIFHAVTAILFAAGGLLYLKGGKDEAKKDE